MSARVAAAGASNGPIYRARASAGGLSRAVTSKNKPAKISNFAFHEAAAAARERELFARRRLCAQLSRRMAGSGGGAEDYGRRRF